MSSFEEDFPSLKEKGKWVNCVDDEKRVEGSVCAKCGTDHTLTFELMRKLMQEHCLDKQKVRKTLKNVLPLPEDDEDFAGLKSQQQSELSQESESNRELRQKLEDGLGL